MSSKIQDLTAITSATAVLSDVLPMVHDPAGTPVDRKITLNHLIATHENARGFWDFVRDFGADNTGVSDTAAAFSTAFDTIKAAGGGTLFLRAGTYLVSRALQNTGTDNAQIPFPLNDWTVGQISIKILGSNRPPTQYGPTSSNPLPVAGFSIIKSTLTGGSGTASVFGGRDPGTTPPNWYNANNINWNWENLILQLPQNPSLTGIDLQYQQACEIKNVLVHTGNVDIGDVAFFATAPTNTTQYGVKAPDVNHSAWTRVEGLTIFGCYHGFRSGENIYGGTGIRFWACYKGIVLPSAFHPASFTDLGSYWTPYSIVAGGGPIDGGKTHVRIDALDLENPNAYEISPGVNVPAWMTTVYNVDDATNLIYGYLNWTSVKSFVGNDHTLIKNSATNLVSGEI